MPQVFGGPLAGEGGVEIQKGPMGQRRGDLSFRRSPGYDSIVHLRAWFVNFLVHPVWAHFDRR